MKTSFTFFKDIENSLYLIDTMSDIIKEINIARETWAKQFVKDNIAYIDCVRVEEVLNKPVRTYEDNLLILEILREYNIHWIIEPNQEPLTWKLKVGKKVGTFKINLTTTLGD